MPRTIAHVTSWLMVFSLSNALWMLGANLEADMVLYNGRILTADNEDPSRFTIAQAVAIYDGKFVAVGSNQEALALAGSSTRRIDLDGRAVLPGLIETHLHVHSMTAGHYIGRALEDTDPPIRWTTKDEVLAQLKTLALQKKRGEWVIVSIRGVAFDTKAENTPAFPSLQELDQVTPNNPVIVGGVWSFMQANSRALEFLQTRYPQGIPGILTNREGNPTGVLEGAAAMTMSQIWPELSQLRIEELAPLFEKELEEPAARGLTTVATRVDTQSLRIYQLLDQQGRMPVRLAYAAQMAADSLEAEVIFRRVPGVGGHGTPWLWLAGATTGTVEGRGSGPVTGGACVREAYSQNAPNFPAWRQEPYGPHGECRLTQEPVDTVLRNFFLTAARFGWPVTNIHVNGDRGLDDYLTLLEEADRKYGISDLRFSADHCGYVTEEQAQRANRLGLSITCTPSSFGNAEKSILGAYATIYDKERAGDSYAPFRRLVRLGMRPSIHCEGHTDWPFTCLKHAITRKDDASGTVWGPQQRINRREALYTYTRWAAWHVWKEKYIGTIEPGKWADLIIVDQDYLTIPEEQISDLNPLLTIVGGKIRYSEVKFAASKGLPVVGFQPPPSWWQR